MSDLFDAEYEARCDTFEMQQEFCKPCDEEEGKRVPAVAVSEELGPLCRACADSYFPGVAAERRYAAQYAAACGY